MKRSTMAVVLIASTCGLPAFAQTEAASTTAANNLPSPDKEFVQAASMSSSTEIDASKLAANRSQDKDVKSFAHHMMLDHTKLALSLKMAAPNGAAVPKDNSDTALLNTLSGLHGKEFDKIYIKEVGVAGHQKAVAAFQTEAEGGQNANLKKAAQKGLPTIKEHLEMAQQLATKKGLTSQ